MTPREKAKELVEKFLPVVRGADRYNYNLDDMNVFIARHIALITVDEIVKHKPREPMNYTDTKGYWKEVKREIEEL